MVVSLAGCTSYAPIDNKAANGVQLEDSYSLRAHYRKERQGDYSLALAFSGGGTRAAALSYGVLEALRDTGVETPSRQARLRDSVYSISYIDISDIGSQ